MTSDGRIVEIAKEPQDTMRIFAELMSRHAIASKIWTNAYLAAFAIAGGYKLVTFDRGFEQFEGLRLEVL